jgi:Glyoxalase-like domain
MSTALHPPYRLIVGTQQLARGKIWLEKFLHVQLCDIVSCREMGTHSYYLSLGQSVTLELVAIDPAAAAPQHPRYYGLDTVDVIERISQRPRLIGWVARSAALSALQARIGGLLGDIHQISVPSSCLVTSPADGYPIEGGLIPQMLEEIVSPEVLRDQGIRFTWMEAAHPNPAKVNYLLGELGLANSLVLTTTAPYAGMTMCAYLDTPNGVKTLMS